MAPDLKTHVPAKDSFRANLFNPPDFKITVDKFVWNVHQQVLIDSSTFLATMCSGKFKEAGTRETTLHDDPVQVAQMIMYMYTGYNAITRTHDLRETWPHLSLDNMLKAGFQGEDADAAVEYVFSSLKYENSAEWRVKTHLDMYTLADNYCIPSLGTRALDVMFNSGVEAGREIVWSIVDFIEATGMDTAELKKRLAVYLWTTLNSTILTPDSTS